MFLKPICRKLGQLPSEACDATIGVPDHITAQQMVFIC
ncbi:hypothetical protein SDC9_103808 [bioreactor metagenome]|uniref:Uncharacterized protein n=1 Tax=bioreactor metagenome TaxID=1076179 RepID=A0A645AXG0_9ZZZZ